MATDVGMKAGGQTRVPSFCLPCGKVLKRFQHQMYPPVGALQRKLVPEEPFNWAQTKNIGADSLSSSKRMEEHYSGKLSSSRKDYVVRCFLYSLIYFSSHSLGPCIHPLKLMEDCYGNTVSWLWLTLKFLSYHISYIFVPLLRTQWKVEYSSDRKLKKEKYNAPWKEIQISLGLKFAGKCQDTKENRTQRVLFF